MRRPALRHVVPVALFLFGATLTALSYLQEMRDSTRAFRDKLTQVAASQADRLAGELEFFVGRGDEPAAELQVSSLGTTPDLIRALATDDRDSVLFTTDVESRGQVLGRLAAHLRAVAPVARGDWTGGTALIGDTLVAVTPWRLRPLPGELRSSRLGLVIVEFDLGGAKAAAREAAAQRSLSQGGIILLLSLLAWWLVTLVFTRPAERLAEAHRRLAQGETVAPLPPSGPAEMAFLAERFTTMATQITDRRVALEELNRALRMVSECNQVLVRATDEQGLLESVCRVIVAEGGYRMAWVGVAEEDADRTVRPVAWAGHVEGYLELARISWADVPQGRGPTGTCVREARPVLCQDIATDPRMTPWRDEALRRGYHASISLPIRIGGRVTAVLTAYAPAPGALTDEAVKLLTEMAEELGFGISTLRARADHARAEGELAAREALFRSAFVHSPIGMAIALPDARWRDVNPAFCRMLGYSRDELLRLDFRQVTHPDDLPGDFAEIERLRRGEGEHYTRQKRYFHRDGHEIWTAVNVAVVRHPDGTPQYFTVQVEDITERRRADEALRESEARFRQLAENIQEVFYVADVPERRIRYVSPAYDRIWGRPGGELLAEPWRWLESIHPDDRARVRQAAQQQQPQGLYDEEYRVVRPDGSVRWIHDRSFPIRDAAGEVYRVVGVAEDITARRAVEDELRQAQKMEGIGQLAGGVAHDFNNILTAILMQVELAAGEPGLPAEVAEALDGIRESARRAADLTRQLLVFSRKQVIQRRQLDLNESVLGLAKMLQRVLREDIHLEVRLAPGPLWMVGDTGMVDQVLVNLAVNARDAMPDGGTVTIETDTRLLTPEEARAHPGARPGPCVLVRVRDTGTGIPPELLPRIFEPFFTTKEPGQGTGLGLATVFGIVQQHRGALGVQSVVGQGTTFEVLFPARGAAAAPARNGDAAEARQGAGEVVLLTEDDAAIRTLIASVLTKSGYEVVTAPDGPSALERWRERGGKVDLLMTDLVMPSGMSGHELAARLRQERPGLKVLFTSGYPRDFAGKEFKLEPGQHFLPKPATPAQLLELVRRCLEG